MYVPIIIEGFKFCDSGYCYNDKMQAMKFIKDYFSRLHLLKELSERYMSIIEKHNYLEFAHNNTKIQIIFRELKTIDATKQKAIEHQARHCYHC